MSPERRFEEQPIFCLAIDINEQVVVGVKRYGNFIIARTPNCISGTSPNDKSLDVDGSAVTGLCAGY